jgi:hypothetical protein
MMRDEEERAKVIRQEAKNSLLGEKLREELDYRITLATNRLTSESLRDIAEISALQREISTLRKIKSLVE